MSDLLDRAVTPCSPACPFAACARRDDPPPELDRQTTIYDHMEDQ